MQVLYTRMGVLDMRSLVVRDLNTEHHSECQKWIYNLKTEFMQEILELLKEIKCASHYYSPCPRKR